MKFSALRISCIAIGLLMPVGFTMRGASKLLQVEEGHLSGFMARITLPDGVIENVKLEGVGCSSSMCSRTAIKGKADHDTLVKTWFDTISTIKDPAGSDVLLVLRDGTQRRMSLMTDFRVLYFTNASGAFEKLDLTNVKSVEFLARSR